MRLANGIITDKEKTFGKLKFSALRREVLVQNEDGAASIEVKERTYDYNAEVEIINPVADTVATATYMGADVDWYIKAEDIVLKNGKQPVQANIQQTQNKN